ncbi:MAG: ArnT family glycosyltransferase [Elusimicrobiota bacterium]
MKKYCPVILLLIFFLICIFSYQNKSPTYDEIQHLSSGYLTLKTGKMDIGIGHPHLFRIFIALPLLVMNPEYSHKHPILNRNLSDNPTEWSVRLEYDFAYDFFYKQKNNSDLLFFWGRLFSVFIGMILGAGIYFLARNIYGDKGGIFSLFLFVFSPTIIAHSRLTVNDIAGAGAIFFTLFAVIKYIKDNRINNFLLMSLAAGISFLTKFNAVLLIPFILGVMILKDKKKAVFKYIIFILILMLIINIFYGFNNTFSQKQLNFRVFSNLIPFKVFDSWAYAVYRYLPLPEAYLKSFIRLMTHGIRGHSSFLMGNYSTHGWWYYFPIAFLIKTPVFILGMIIFWIINTCKYKQINNSEIVLISFFALFLIVSVNTGINIGHRHLLPIYPIIFVLLGKVFNQKKAYINKKSLIIGLPMIYVFFTQLYFPHYIPFFNILVTPCNGYKYLLDSNLDWGQDLPGLKKYLSENGNPGLIFSYFGTASIKHYGIRYQNLLGRRVHEQKSTINPYNTKKEYLAVSANNLQGLYFKSKKIFGWLKEKEPVKKIGYSIFVYDISKDENTTAKIGEMYRLLGKKKYALRQYRRILYISDNKRLTQWARQRIESIKNEQ